MKIVNIEDLHCNAGWRDFSFLKITTDEGLIGWSEYNEGYGSAGLNAVIRRMAQDLIGHDPMRIGNALNRSRGGTASARDARAITAAATSKQRLRMVMRLIIAGSLSWPARTGHLSL